MKDVNNQAAGLAREIFVQLSTDQQRVINSIATKVNSTYAWPFVAVKDQEILSHFEEIDEYLHDDLTVIINREKQLSWPHPVALPKPNSDDEVFISWTYDSDRKTYYPRRVYAILGNSEMIHGIEFGLTRLMCLWQCVSRKAFQNPSEQVTAESCALTIREALLGLGHSGIRNEAISRHAKRLISELNKASKQEALRLKPKA